MGRSNCYVNQGAGHEVVRESRPLVFDACKYSEHMPTVVTRPNHMYTQKVVVRERLLSNAYLVQTSQAFKIKLGRSFVCGSDSCWCFGCAELSSDPEDTKVVS